MSERGNHELDAENWAVWSDPVYKSWLPWLGLVVRIGYAKRTRVSSSIQFGRHSNNRSAKNLACSTCE